jgi:plasmid stability protein
MPTLYVENVPKALYEAIRKQAKAKKSSIAAEVIQILADRVPTEAVLRRRREAYEEALRLSKTKPLTPGPHPSAEEMLREAREGR